MSNTNKVEIDFTLLAVILAVLFFNGKPDLCDALIYKLTGIKVWEQPE